MGSWGTVRVDSGELAYQHSEGQGRPVVFVHGNSSSARTWQTLLDGPFGTRFRCLAIDLPGHGRSPVPTAGPVGYAVPAYSEVLAGFVRAMGLRDAVVVGWSLGGHVALEASGLLGEEAAGYVLFGTPPVSDGSSFSRAYLPNPAFSLGFEAALTQEHAAAYAAASLSAESTVPVEPLVEDILATDGSARSGLAQSIGEGRFADEVAILKTIGQPVAILHGAAEQVVDRDYLEGLTVPTLWRGAVQTVEGAGHAIHLDCPAELSGLLEAFIGDLPLTVPEA